MVDLRFTTSPLEGSALSKDLPEVQHITISKFYS
jgi:hypothetical protein